MGAFWGFENTDNRDQKDDNLVVLPLMYTVGAVLLVGIMYLVYRAAKAEAKRTNRAWRVAAEHFAGQFNPRVGRWYNRTRRIDATVQGCPVLVDHYTQGSGEVTWQETRIRANVEYATDFKLTVSRKDLLGKVATALGMQDIKTGDERFDECFVVKSNDEDLARTWLDESVRERLLETNDYRFTIKNGRLKAVMGSLATNADPLIAAMWAAGALAIRGSQLFDWWRQVADERIAEIAEDEMGKLRIDVTDQAAPLRIEPRSAQTSTGTATRVSARRVDASKERFQLVSSEKVDDGLRQLSAEQTYVPQGYVCGSVQPELTAKRISPELKKRIEELGPLRIEADETSVYLEVDELEGNTERLQEAMEIVTELATQTAAGPYR